MQSYVKGSFWKTLLESSNIFISNFKNIKFYEEVNVIKDDEKCTYNIFPGADLMHKCHSDFVVKIKLLSRKKDIQYNILDFQLIT